MPTDDTHDAHGCVVTSDAKGDGPAAVPEVCATTGYTTSASSNPNMLDYVDEVKAVNGACRTAMTAFVAQAD